MSTPVLFFYGSPPQEFTLVFRTVAVPFIAYETEAYHQSLTDLGEGSGGVLSTLQWFARKVRKTRQSRLARVSRTALIIEMLVQSLGTIKSKWRTCTFDHFEALFFPPASIALS